jgi:hypothetical protein
MAVTTSQELKRLRQRAIRQLVRSRPVGSQRELVDALIEQGFDVTQATVSRDITELGLVKAPPDGRLRRSGDDRHAAGPAAVGRTGCTASSPMSRSGSAGAGSRSSDRHARHGQRRGPGHR